MLSAKKKRRASPASRSIVSWLEPILTHIYVAFFTFRRSGMMSSSSRGCWTYLIFVIFFTEAKFLENKIYTEKRVNYDKIHRKLPIFCVITAKYTVNCQFFALNLWKFTPAKKNLHENSRGFRDKYEVCPPPITIISIISWSYLISVTKATRILV